MDLSFKGAAKRLDDIDLPKLGYMMRVGEDELHAFLDVETTGSGFDSRGRPKMLFEPHKFYAKLSGAKRSAAVKAGVAYKNYGEKPYPSDSYPRLKTAMDIDVAAAMESCSWGIGQVLGEYWKTLGYGSVGDMVQAFMDDEEAQLLGSVRFIIKNGLDKALRAHDWATFARGYNGSAYRKNRYDEKMAAAYAKWFRIKDTAWEPPAAGVITPTLRPDPPPALAQVGTKPDVVLMDGPKKDETTVVVVQHPDNPPATNPMPTSKTGYAAFGAILVAVGAAAAKYFGG